MSNCQSQQCSILLQAGDRELPVAAGTDWWIHVICICFPSVLSHHLLNYNDSNVTTN